MEDVQRDLLNVITKSALIIDGIRPPHLDESAVWVCDAHEMREQLRIPSISYHSIFLSADQPRISFLESARALRSRFPLSPMYLLFDSHPPISKTELTRLGFHGAVVRKEIHYFLRDKLQRQAQFTEKILAASKKRARSFHSAVYLTQAVTVEGFLPLHLEDILNGERSLFDIHMLLPNRKRVKIFKANEPLDSTRVLKLMAAGIRWVYIRKESLDRCQSRFDFISRNMMQIDQISKELKLLHIASISDRLSAPSSTSLLDETQAVVSLLRELLSGTKIEQSQAIQSYFKHAHSLEHAVSTAFISVTLGRNMKIESGTILQQIGITALLHDLGLSSLPEKLKSENLAEMTDAEILEFKTHPRKSVDLLRALGVNDEAVLQGIAQHHERRDGSGFPNKSGAGEIHSFAEIVGIAEELNRFLKNRSQSDLMESLRVFKEQVQPRFSANILEAFETICLGVAGPD